ncbi:MAG: oxygenase MpaB family protein [Corynebacterium sp.]|uniref:oxygenase MpaB family protein n=1 Tax=Corynebacterium sp. TaxID=1720 RepID=UPI003F9142AB
MANRRNQEYVRHDEGVYGPGSVAWKVWTFPASALHGFARAVTIEHLDPDLVAAVDDSGQVVQRTPLRYDRTMEYFAAVLFADARTVTRMSDILMKVHSRAYGTNKVTGNGYDSNNPDSQLWILVTAWHSILYVYEKFGPGKLSRDEENEYWQACATAAKFQPIDPADVPRTRGEVQKYFDDWRERLSASEAAVFNINHILNGFETAFVDLPKPLRAVVRPFFRRGVIATYPRWMRGMMGLKQSKLTDTLMVALWKPVFAAFKHLPDLEILFLENTCPRAVRYIEPAIRGIPAESPKVYTPEVARREWGDPRTPLEQQQDLLAKRNEGEGVKTYEHNHHDEILEFKQAEREAEEQTDGSGLSAAS